MSAPDGKVSKQSVHYRAASVPGKRCGTCSMFSPISKSKGECSLVIGVVMGVMVCDKWEPKSGNQGSQG